MKQQELMRKLEYAYKQLAKQSKCKTFSVKRTEFGTFVYTDFKK